MLYDRAGCLLAVRALFPSDSCGVGYNKQLCFVWGLGSFSKIKSVTRKSEGLTSMVLFSRC